MSQPKTTETRLCPHCGKPFGTAAEGEAPPPIRGLKLYEADEKLLSDFWTRYAAWCQAFPGLDVTGEIRRAHAWELAQPPRQRKKNRARFLTTWLKREWRKFSGQGRERPPGESLTDLEKRVRV